MNSKNIGERITNKFSDIPESLAIKILAEYLTNTAIKKTSLIKNGFRSGMPIDYQVYRITDGTGTNNARINNLDVKMDFSEGDSNNNILIRSLIPDQLPYHRIHISFNQIKTALDSLNLDYLAIIHYCFFAEKKPNQELDLKISQLKRVLKRKPLSSRQFLYRQKVQALKVLIGLVDERVSNE